MDFTLDWLNPSSIELEQVSTNLKSESELNLWATPEDLTDSQKAELLMETGFPLQKSWVMQNLYLIPTSTSLLKHIFVSTIKKNIINWPEELQLECGTGLMACIKRKLLPEEFKLECIQLSLTFLSFYSRTLHQKWLPVYTSLLPSIPLQTIKQKLLSEIMLLSDCSQKAMTREVSCHLLSELAEVLGKEFKGPLLQRVKSLSQDTCPEVREEMGKVWTGIIRVLGRTAFEESIFFDVLKLLEDEVLSVRTQGVRVLIFSLELVSDTFFSKDVSQVLKNFYKGLPGQMEDVLCENLGRVAAGTFGQHKEEILRVMQRFVKTEKYRKSLAFNYPGLVAILGLSNEIKEIGLVLAEDSSNDVVKTLAGGFHEVLALNKYCKILKKISSKLVEHPEARLLIFKKLQKWSPLYDPSLLLIKFIKFLTLPIDWRIQTDLFQVFIDSFQSFNLKEILDHFIPLILHKMLTACWPVKSSACRTLCHILINTYYIPRKLDICNIVKEKLARSNSSYDRVLFIEFCEILSALCSKRFFSKYFLQDFLNLVFDRTPNVLIRFFKACYVIGVFGFKQNICDVLEQISFDAKNENMKNELFGYFKSIETENKISENWVKDKQKEKFEAELETMEVREVESIRKRAADEMALKVTVENNNKNKKVLIKGRILSESIDPKARTRKSTAMLKPQPMKKK